ncbi:MAG: SDR family oxidoreductase [Bdellovibrionota bacterium]
METDKIKTAFITGASSGIGFSLAHEFAKKKYNLILVARDTERLKKLKEECEKKYHVQAHTLSCDLSRVENSLAAIKKLVSALHIQVDVLVNNAGFGVHGSFSETSLDKEIDMVNLQTASVISLTKLFLPGMIERKSGAILNVGSVYSYTPVPYQAVYGACKSFLLSFSLSMAHEVKKHGVTVTVLCPGTTKTEFRARSKIKQDRILKGMSSHEVARQAINSLDRGDLICIPGVANKFFISLASMLPTKALSSLISYVNDKRGVNHI